MTQEAIEADLSNHHASWCICHQRRIFPTSPIHKNPTSCPNHSDNEQMNRQTNDPDY